MKEHCSKLWGGLGTKIKKNNFSIVQTDPKQEKTGGCRRSSGNFECSVYVGGSRFSNSQLWSRNGAQLHEIFKVPFALGKIIDLIYSLDQLKTGTEEEQKEFINDRLKKVNLGLDAAS